MWTKLSRSRMVLIAWKTKCYPSDLTDEEWEQIAPLISKLGRHYSPLNQNNRPVANIFTSRLNQIILVELRH